jgi:hypothetical protein
MRTVKWLLAAGLIAATTAACTEQYGYPTTSYNSGYNNGYYRNGVYYSNNTGYANNSPYYSNRGYASTPRTGPSGDYDRDGIPNRYDRDANGDGVPDRYQR